MGEIWVFLFLFNHFHFLGKVFWVRLSVEIPISRVSIPIVSSSELIREIGIVIFFGLFSLKFIRISAFASEREIASCVFISRLHILVISFMSGKLS